MAASPTASRSTSTGSRARSSSARTRRPFSRACTASSFPAASASAAPRARSRRRAIARERKIPYFGICFGMQMAVIEAARSLAGVGEANSTEFGPTPEPVVGLLTEWLKGSELEKRTANGDLGGTMRLGAYPARLRQGSRVAEVYGATEISERHRHRYEVNMAYRDRLEEEGLVFSGLSPDGLLPEIVEHEDHPWFIGVQFHPELKSRPVRAAPAVQGLRRGGGGAGKAGVMRRCVRRPIDEPRRTMSRRSCSATYSRDGDRRIARLLRCRRQSPRRVALVRHRHPSRAAVDRLDQRRLYFAVRSPTFTPRENFLTAPERMMSDFETLRR